MFQKNATANNELKHMILQQNKILQQLLPNGANPRQLYPRPPLSSTPSNPTKRRRVPMSREQLASSITKHRFAEL